MPLASFDELTKAPDAIPDSPLVNENSGGANGAGVLDFVSLTQPPAAPTREQSSSLPGIEASVAEKRYRAALPKTWFGELWNGARASVDQLQQLGYAGGAVAADTVGLDSLKNWFIEGSRAQDKEIAGEPRSVEDTGDIHGFDSFMRWFAGSAGQAVPQLAESAITAAIGGLAGSAVGPEGTIGGALTGFVEKQAIADALKGAVSAGVRKELISYGTGQLERASLSEAAQSVLVNQTRGLLAKYGTDTVIGLNSWAMQTAMIYDGMKDQPDTPDSAKKASAIFGGLVAAIPDTAFKAYIANKFFPSGPASASAVNSAESYLKRFAQAGAKELPTVVGSGFGQVYAQTLVDKAAENYANPATRDDFLNFTPDQWHQMFEAGTQGAVAGIAGAGIAAHGEAMQPHPNADVRAREAAILTKANDLQPAATPAAGSDNERLSAIAKRRDELTTALAKPDLAEPDRQSILKEQTDLQAEEDKILGTTPLVNENGTPAVKEDVAAMSQQEFAEWLSKPGNAKALLGARQPTSAALYDLLTRKPEFRQQDAPAATSEEQKAAYATMDALGAVHEKQGEGWNYTNIGDAKTKNEDGSRTKGYVTFNNLSDLTPESLKTFIDTLKTEGFNGAVKTLASMPFSEKGFRTRFDNIVFHVKSDADLAIAEKVANQVFGADKITLSRGVDPTERNASGGKQSHTEALAGKVYQSLQTGKPLVNEKTVDSETPKSVISPPVRTLTPLEQSVAHLRAFYARETPSERSSVGSIPFNVDAVVEQRTKLTSLVNEITKNAATPEEAQTYGTGIHQAFDDNVLNFLHHEGIDVRQANERDLKALKGADNFAVLAHGADDISIVLPDINTVRTQGESTAIDTTDAAKEKGVKGYLKAVPDIVQHELVHAFDYVALRDQWRAEGEQGAYRKFLQTKLRERGAALRQAYDSLPREAFSAYQFGDIGKFNDETLGEEFMRMVVQSVRTGKTDEVVQALHRAMTEGEADQKDKGGISNMLKNWVSALKGIFEKMKRVLDPKTAPPEFIKDYDSINKALDKYKVLVNESKAGEDKAHKSTESTTTEQSANRSEPVQSRAEKPVDESKTLEPATGEPLTIQEAVDRNAKVERDGIRGRLVRDTDGALVIRNKDNTYLVKDAYEPDASVEDLGIKVLRASPVKEDIRDTQAALNEATPEVAQSEVARQQTEAVPKFVQDAQDHPLLNELHDVLEVGQSKQPRKRALLETTPEYKRLLGRVTPEQLDTAENIVTNTIDRIEKLGLDPEKEKAMSQPFYDMWNGIDTLRQKKEALDNERKANAEAARESAAREVQPVLQAAPDETRPAETNPEPAAKPKARVSKEERAAAKLQSVIAEAKAGKRNITDAMQAHMDMEEKLHGAMGDNPERISAAAKEFQQLYGKGATQKLYKQVAALVNEKPPARAAQIGGSNLDATTEKNINDAKMMRPDDPAGFLREMAARARANQKYDAADNFDKAANEVEKAPAQAARPTMRRNDNRIMDQLSEEINQWSDRKFSQVIPKPSEEKIRQGKAIWEGAPPSVLRYESKTETQSAKEAQEAITAHGGALRVAEGLMGDRLGKFLNFTEDDPDVYYPLAKLKAVKSNVISQLDSLLKRMGTKGASMDAIGYVGDIMRQLTREVVANDTEQGVATQMADSGAQIRDAVTAKNTFVDTIMDSAEKVLGNGARTNIQALVSKLNDNIAKAAGLASVAPKVIKNIRDIQESIKGAKFEKGYRQTLVQNLTKLKDVVNKAAARAAQYIAGSVDNPAKLDKLAKSLISEFTGIPKDKASRTEEQVFMATVGKFVRGIGKDMGLVTKEPVGTKDTVAAAMSAILKNGEAYRQFAHMFVQDYIKEYGGDKPSQKFMDEANAIHASIMSKADGRDLVKPLVNEKMRELETKFSDLVREHYNKGQFETEVIRDSIAKEMRDHGVTDPAVIDQLSRDVEESMQSSLQDARDKFFGSSPTIREFLKHMGLNLREAATSLAVHADNLEGQLKENLIQHFGFPDTPDMPIASDTARVMQEELNHLVAEQNAKDIKAWLDQAEKGLANPNAKRRRLMQNSVEQVLKMTKAGVMRQEDVYRALAEHFTELPPYREETVNRIEQIGEAIYNSQHPRQINALKQEAADLLTQAQPLSTTKARTAAMYYSFLSGPSTILGSNPGGNTAQLIAYIGENILKSIHKPQLVYDMLRAAFSAATGKAFWEARETWFNGMELGKQSAKYMTMRSPFELKDPYFQSGITRDTPLKNKLADIDEKMSGAAFKLANSLGGKYVIRALLATDIYFGKIAEEIAFTQKVGQRMGTESMFLDAMDEAKREMRAIGVDPESDIHTRSRMMVLANSIFEKARLYDDSNNLVNERAIAWSEAHGEALRVTLNQEPKGLFGALHRAIQTAGREFPILRLFIPFTKIAANSVNMALEYTPIGALRYLAGGEFKKTVGGNATFDETGQLIRRGGEQVRDTDILIRSAIGTLALGGLATLMGQQSPDHKEEPFFWIYGNGPRDKTMRGMLFERGWKPNTVKVGGTYYNYLLSPLAMTFSILGYHADKYLDGQLPHPDSIGVASSGVALMDAVTNQSFLASISDFMGAVDSPDPEAKLNRLFARTGSVIIPSWAKQLDRFVDPSLQQADSFSDVMISQLPFARKALKPYLNYFGQPVEKSRGSLPLPGMQVLATDQRSEDSVINFLTDNSIDLPGYSKSTRLGNAPMTDDQRYEYVQIAGPRIHQRIAGELSELETMDRQQQKDTIRKIAEEEKAKARNELTSKYSR